MKEVGNKLALSKKDLFRHIFVLNIVHHHFCKSPTAITIITSNRDSTDIIYSETTRMKNEPIIKNFFPWIQTK